VLCFTRYLRAEGTVFEGEVENGDITMCTESITRTEAPVGSFFWFCQFYENYVILTETHLLGEYDCGIITVV
jgi:hypothetical protein